MQTLDHLNAISNKQIRIEIKGLLAKTQLSGRVLWQPQIYENQLLSFIELKFYINGIKCRLCLPKAPLKTLVLTIKIPKSTERQDFCLILHTIDESTYREKQLVITEQLRKICSLSQLVMKVVEDLDSRNIDISSICCEAVKKVNLPLQLQRNFQGLKLSHNSSFSLIRNCNKQQNAIKYQKTRKSQSQSSLQIAEKHRPIKKRKNQPMKKNANLPKFLIRIFIKYVEKFRKAYPKKQFDRLYVECKKMKEWKKSENKQQALGLKHLRMLFQEDRDNFPDSKLNRSVIIKIISQYLLEQICQNSQIPQTHRLGYLIACRVYSLRCRNSALAGRIQSK